MTVSSEPIRYLTRSDLGRVFGVTHDAVLKWQERYPAGSAHPFPSPDGYAGYPFGELEKLAGHPLPSHPGSDRSASLWLPERLDEIRVWHETRPESKRTGRPPGTRLGGNVLRD